MQENRYKTADYYEMPPENLAAHREARVSGHAKNPSVNHAEFLRILDSRFPEMNEKLLAKNGKMIFVRMPTSDEHWLIDEKLSPRNKFWDEIGKRTDIPTIHFKDYPELDEFDCPDTSHLDASDAPEFTKRLAEIIKPLIIEHKQRSQN